MGGGNGYRYLGTKASFKASSLDKNFNSLKKYYPKTIITSGGFLGHRGTTSLVRVIYTVDPIKLAQIYYNKLKAGGKEKIFENRQITKLGDGSNVQLRIKTSTEGSPAVEISQTGSALIRNQKIHFVKI